MLQKIRQQKVEMTIKFGLTESMAENCDFQVLLHKMLDASICRQKLKANVCSFIEINNTKDPNTIWDKIERY